ncbi:hypothetical protein AB3S75_031066 [Citrus x aurantiifolia]
MLPRHARLQNMTYSSRMKLNVQLQRIQPICPQITWDLKCSNPHSVNEPAGVHSETCHKRKIQIWNRTVYSEGGSK